MAGDARSVQVRHPAPHDVVGSTFTVAGVGTGFEGTVGWRLLRGDGEVIAQGGVQAGGMGVLGELVFTVDLAGVDLPPDEHTVVLQAFGDNPGLPEEGPDPGFDVNTVPLTVGPRIVDGYFGFALHQVVPGDTLTRIAAGQQLGSTTVQAIFRANRDLLHDPDLIHPGQVLRVPLGT